jgi:DNA polymerase III subunit beta
MDIEVLQENIAKSLSLASRFVIPRAQLPVLGNILLTAKQNKLKISSTNLETSISISIGAKIKEPGEVTVPSRIITELVGNLTSGSLNLKAKGENVILAKDGFKSKILGMNSSDFPKIPTSPPEDLLEIESDLFFDALERVNFAISSDESRPVLTGVLFEFDKKGLNLVSTDGFRLSKVYLDIKSKLELSVIIPKTILFEIGRVFADEEKVSFNYSKENNQIIFCTDRVVLSSRVIGGSFPDYKKILPKEKSIKMLVDKDEFARAVKLSSVFARESSNAVKMSIQKEKIVLSTESGLHGSQENLTEAKVEGLAGESFDSVYNYKFLEDAISAIKGEDVEIVLNEANTPGVFLDSKNRNFVHIIMPIKS